MAFEFLLEWLSELNGVFTMIPGYVWASIITAAATAVLTHKSTKLIEEDRRQKERANLRSILRTELRSNTKQLWTVFLATEQIDIIFWNREGARRLHQPMSAESAEESARRRDQQKKSRTIFWAKQYERGIDYSHYEAVQGKVGRLSRDETEKLQDAYIRIKTLDGYLSTIAPSEQHIGEGDNILTIERENTASSIRHQAPRALEAQMVAISELGELSPIEEDILTELENDSTSPDELERIHKSITKSDSD